MKGTNRAAACISVSVFMLYAAHAAGQDPDQEHVAEELRKTRPLSVIMAERVAALRTWARGRTVPAE